MPGRARPRASQRLLGSSPSGIRVRISAPTLPPDGGWRRPVAPLPRPALEGDQRPTWWSSEAATRGCGLPGTCSIRSRASVSSCWRAASADTARAAATAGFCESLWFSAPALRERFGDDAARSRCSTRRARPLARSAPGADDNDVDAWFDQSGLPGRLDRRGVRRRGARRRRGRRGARQAGGGAGPVRRADPRAGGLARVPPRRARARLRDRAAGAAGARPARTGCWSAGRRSSRTRACAAPSTAAAVRWRRETAGGRVRAESRRARGRARRALASARSARACP